jgi:hypothetical protein
VDTGDKRNILVMMVSFGLLCPSSDGCQTTVIRFFLLFLELPPFAAPGRLGYLYRRLWWNIQLVATMRTVTTIGKLGPCGNRTRDGADSSPYTREHATKLALDTGLTSRASELRLGSLYGLGKGRNPPLAVDLLNP